MRNPILLTLLLTCFQSPAHADSRYYDLDQWLSRDLLPFVRETLAEHPRFRGEALRFVVMDNGNPQAASDRLTLDIRDRIRDAAADIRGVRIAWQPDDPHYAGNAGPAGLDCTRTEVHYLIGIETRLTDSQMLAVDVRALDVEDGTVVTDFSRSWQGRITRSQYRDFRYSEIDLTFRGEREAPYDATQSDLLAAHLAHDLGCNLLRQTEAEYVITGADGNRQPDPVRSMVELVNNNLARVNSLQFTSAADGANAVIEGKAHRIDDDLYQYWVTVQAIDPDSELQALSASAYIRLPEQFSLAVPYVEPVPALTNEATILDAVRIVELGNPHACPAARLRNSSSAYGRGYDGGGDCYALQVRTRGDAVVFFLNHQLNHGLVRLSGPGCARSAEARIARAGVNLQFPLPQDSLPTDAWSSGAAWDPEPDLDTYYAVAASDTQAARRLSQHIARLPNRCSGSIRPGLEGHALREWMAELGAIVERWGPAVDWHILRVKNVY